MGQILAKVKLLAKALRLRNSRARPRELEDGTAEFSKSRASNAASAEDPEVKEPDEEASRKTSTCSTHHGRDKEPTAPDLVSPPGVLAGGRVRQDSGTAPTHPPHDLGDHASKSSGAVSAITVVANEPLTEAPSNATPAETTIPSIRGVPTASSTASTRTPSPNGPGKEAPEVTSHRSTQAREDCIPVATKAAIPVGLREPWRKVTGPSITYIRSTRHKYSFTRCSFHNVKATDCDWQNVSFTDCKLSNVAFTGVTLKNVHFRSIDFRSVRLGGITIQNVVWEEQAICWLCIDKESFDYSDAPYGVVLLPTSDNFRLTRTRGVPLWPQPCLDHQEYTDASDSTTLQTVALSTSGNRTGSLLDLPASILELIVSALYHSRGIWIYDCPEDHFHSVTTRQTTYQSTHAPKGKRTTYLAFSAGRTRKGLQESITRHAKLDLCTAFLRSNKTCYALAVKQVYDRCFTFPHSAESALAFLHDHRREDHRIATLSLFHNMQDTSCSLTTNLPSWRQLFNAIVHERGDIQKLSLTIRKEFWDIAPWKRGADAVWRWTATGHNHLTDHLNAKANFLQHFARVSRRSGVKFTLCIRGTDTPEKTAFVGALGRLLAAESAQRPSLTKDKTGEQCCGRRQLEMSCYWKR